MNAFASLMRRCREEDRLISALIELGFRCPLNCVFCYTKSSVETTSLSLRQYLDFLRELEEHGVMFLSFSGGEPTVHQDFYPLGRAARKSGLVIRIKTAGSHLSPEEIRRIRGELDPFVVEVSIHGARATTHEAQTRVPGSFRRLLGVIETFQDLGQRVELRCVLSRLNEVEIQSIQALARSLGTSLTVDTEVGPVGGVDGLDEKLAPSRDGLCSFFRNTVPGEDLQTEDPGCDDEEPGGRYCGAGSSTITLDPDGNILPCPAWRTPLGSLHEKSFTEIWRDSEILPMIRRSNEAVARKIRSISGGEFLAFCPGHALARGTAPDEIYAQAWRRRDAFMLK